MNEDERMGEKENKKLILKRAVTPPGLPTLRKYTYGDFEIHTSSALEELTSEISGENDLQNIIVGQTEGCSPRITLNGVSIPYGDSKDDEETRDMYKRVFREAEDIITFIKSGDIRSDYKSNEDVKKEL